MEEKKYRDLFDKHNVLSRFAGLIIVLGFIAMMYVGLFTDKVLQSELISYSSISIMIVFGGISLIANNFDKILDIVKSFRS